MKIALLSYFLLVCFVGGSQIVWAQESAPHEPPYTQVDNEFEGSAPAEVRQESPTGKTQKIHHPLAKEGLQLIDRDGVYYFKAKRSTAYTQTSSLRLGIIKPPPNIVSADGTTSYTSMYGEADPVSFFYEYEWQPFKKFGRWGLVGGLGVFSSTGHGRFSCQACTVNGQAALERYTFFGIPLTLGGSYRFQYTDRPWIVPYVSGGLMYFVLAETRDDGKTPNFVGTPTAYGAGGLMFNFSELDSNSGFLLDSEYGVHNLWISLEARQVQATNQDLDVSGTVLTLGVTADY